MGRGRTAEASCVRSCVDALLDGSEANLTEGGAYGSFLRRTRSIHSLPVVLLRGGTHGRDQVLVDGLVGTECRRYRRRRRPQPRGASGQSDTDVGLAEGTPAAHVGDGLFLRQGAGSAPRASVRSWWLAAGDLRRADDQLNRRARSRDRRARRVAPGVVMVSC